MVKIYKDKGDDENGRINVYRWMKDMSSTCSKVLGYHDTRWLASFSTRPYYGTVVYEQVHLFFMLNKFIKTRLDDNPGKNGYATSNYGRTLEKR